jgi:hypothetical protein
MPALEEALVPETVRADPAAPEAAMVARPEPAVRVALAVPEAMVATPEPAVRAA